MARAKTNPTPIDDTASKASSNWLSIVRDVFPQWRDRLRSSRDAGQKLVNLLCDPETRSKIYRVHSSWEEDPNTVCFPDIGFWPGRLRLVADADGGDDHLEVDYGEASDFYDPGGHWEFDVRRRDVERWERLYPELATLPPAPDKEPAPKKKRRTGRVEEWDWDKARIFAKEALKLRGSPRNKKNRKKKWRSDSDLIRLVSDHFVNSSEDHSTPDERTIREKVSDWIDNFEAERN